MTTTRTFLLTLILFGIFISCSRPKVIKNLNGATYTLLNSDSTAVDFPAKFRGDIVVMSFIYTHCPDVCPIITANMKKIQNQLSDTTNVHFVEISFDPERDTPAVLSNYKKMYRLNDQFSMLTGDTATLASLLSHLDILAEKTYADSMQHDSNRYFMKHSNTIYLMDEQGRIRAEYMASAVPPDHVIEDIQKLR